MKLRALLSCAVALVSGCATSDAQKALDGFKSGLMGNKPTPAQVEPSPLAGVFAESDGQWPRVALTIHTLPPDAYVASMAARLPPTYCMNVSAVIWKNSKESRTVPQHPFCLNQAPAKWVGFGMSDFLLWSMSAHTGSNTGTKRTNGPLPPAKNFPEGLKYANFQQGRGGYLFAALLATMGYDMSINSSSDHRLWVVSLPGQTDL